jgi:hypothetical protein
VPKRKPKQGSVIAPNKVSRGIGTTQRAQVRKTAHTESSILERLNSQYIKFEINYPNLLDETCTWRDNKVRCGACSKFVDFDSMAQHVHGSKPGIMSRHKKTVVALNKGKAF